MSGRAMAEWKGLGAWIPSRDLAGTRAARRRGRELRDCRIERHSRSQVVFEKLIAVRYEVHAVVGYEHGRAAKSGPDRFVGHGFAAFPGWLWCGAL